MNASITMLIERDHHVMHPLPDGTDFTEEIEVSVEGNVSLGFRGDWNCPPYGPEAEIELVTDKDGNEIELTAEEEEKAKDRLIECASDEAYNARAEYNEDK